MKKELKFLKRNQIALYAIVLMLMTAGYLNYTTNNKNNSIETSIDNSLQMENDDGKLADIGDAQLVNSNDVVDNNEVETSTKSQDDYFTKSKLERDTMYSQMLETYEKIINSNNTLETQKQSATEEITKINNTKNSIMICENLIKTKGFENNVIFVNGESISVIIGSEELKQEEIAQIQNIISREMNAKIENIHISNK